MSIEIDDDRRAQFLKQMQGFYLDEFDEALSEFRAVKTLDFFLEALGPQVYNQAIQDARRYMQEKLDDIEGEVFRADGM